MTPAARYKGGRGPLTHRATDGSHIVRRRAPRQGPSEAEGDGKRLGYLEYSLPDAHTVRIDYVESGKGLFRGKRLGNRLVDAAVEWARSNKHHVIARCSFARAVLDRTPRSRDVLSSRQIAR